jgi:hypothetical protein
VDFNDMICPAADYDKSCRYRSPYTYLMLDRPQEVRVGRAQLVRASVEPASARIAEKVVCISTSARWPSAWRRSRLILTARRVGNGAVEQATCRLDESSDGLPTA